MKWIISIESGGSKTNCIICDTKGNVIGFGRSGSANLGFANKKDTIESIKRAIQMALENSKIEVKDIDVIFATYFSGDSLIYDVTREYVEDDRVVLINEHDAALVSAIGSEIGAVASSGTGSFVYAGDIKGNKFFLGALGPVLGDEGSGYDIGRRALVACIYSLDKRGPYTVLTEFILDYWNLDKNNLSEHEIIWIIADKVYKSANYQKDIAALTRVVERAAAQEDEVAVNILKAAGEEMAAQMVALLNKFSIGTEPILVGWQGGAWKSGKYMINAFKSKVSESVNYPIKFVEPLFTPVFGTYLLGLKKIGIGWNDELISNLKTRSNYLSYEEGGYDK